MGQDIKRINSILAGNQPRYEYEVNITTDEIIEHGYFSAGRSFIKSILCLYAYQEPKSFIDNAKVTMDNDWLKIATSRNYHHFFPKKHMEGKKGDFYVNHILNITIVDDFLNKRKIRTKAPSIYMKEFQEQNPDLKATMKTHLIDLDHFGVFEDDFDLFFKKRAEKVSEELNERIVMK